MRKLTFVLSTILVCLFLVSSIMSVGNAHDDGPYSQSLSNLDDNGIISNLQNGSLDILSGSLRPDQISKLAGNPNVTLASHLDLGMCELDMNNQKWPTGDPNNKFYKPETALANQSLEFRQAIACLVDRDELVNSPQYFGGYGYRMDVPIPPLQTNYIGGWYSSNTTFTDGQSVIYNFNITRAEHLLDLAGFTMLPPSPKTELELRQDPTTPGKALKPITFVISQDDPRLLRFGQALATRLKNIGIQVNTVIGPRSVCLKEVASYDFNLYIGHWSFDVTPTQYYDLYSSDNYYGYIPGSLSPNYVGFCNNGTLMRNNPAQEKLGFDYWAYKVEYPENTSVAETYNKKAGELFLLYCPVVPLLCQQVFQAYNTNLTGIINNAAYGIDNQVTFSTMSKPNGTVINYGIKWDPASINLNIIISGRAETESSSLTGPAPKLLSMMYDSLMVVNPWTLGPECWLAQSYSVGSWDATAKGGDSDATYVNFTIRPDVYWPNNDTAGRSLDVYDINFTFNFMKACSQGGMPIHETAMSIIRNLKAFDHCNVDPATNTTGVYFLQESAWALQWAGELPIVNRNIWSLLWNTTDPNWQEKVRNYNPAITDLNSNGLPDLSEDGTGKHTFGNWTYEGRMPTVMYSPTVNHYGINQEGIKEAMVDDMFHGAGDVSLDGVINGQDLGLMARAMFRTPASGGTPGAWGAWNPNCDLNSDGVINANDLALTAMNYGNAFNG